MPQHQHSQSQPTVINIHNSPNSVVTVTLASAKPSWWAKLLEWIGGLVLKARDG